MIKIRFYEELNYFIEKKYKKKEIECEYKKNSTVKKIIEDFGVPHSEVDLILVNGISTDFNYKVKDKDRISVYPAFESFDIKEESRVRQEPLRRTNFILDVHLGKLARYLRICGFDTLYRNDYKDEEIVEISKKEKRIILTRDKGLLKRKKVTHGYYVKKQNIKEQIEEIIKRFQLEKILKILSICPVCNSKIENIKKQDIKNKVPEYIYKTKNDFKYCPNCEKVYWKGTHWKNINQVLKKKV